MEKIKIKEAIVTEGKYDKIKLSQLFDTVIFTTNGFDIYKNKKNLQMIKKVAKTHGVIILTDSDSAGFRIRNYLKQCFGDIKVKDAYIPEKEGKERRKATPSKEGLLGVEGIDDEIIINSIMSQTQSVCYDDSKKVTKSDFFSLGLTGQRQSADVRKKLCKKMQLPIKISSNRLLEMVNVIYTKEEFEEIMKNL